MSYYGKGYTYNDIKNLRPKRLTEYFMENLNGREDTITIWTLYNQMFDEQRELSRDSRTAVIEQMDIEVLRYCGSTYSSQEFNNLMSLIEAAYYKKCMELKSRRIANKRDLYFLEIMSENCGFKYRFSAASQLNVTIPIRNVYKESLINERLRADRILVEEYRDS